MNTQLLIQLLINGLIVGALYGVVAMSFVLIYKATQVVNFAQGEFLLIGAWVCWGLLTKYHLPFWLGMPVTLVFMVAFGIALQVCVLRPLIGEPIISVVMVTIGLSTVFQAALKWIFGTNLQPFPPIYATETVDVLGLQIQTVYLMSLAVSLALMGAMAWFFKVSRYGLAMRATAFDQQVAQSLGIPVRSVFAMAWAISAVVSAVAGVVVAGGKRGSPRPPALRPQGVSPRVPGRGPGGRRRRRGGGQRRPRRALGLRHQGVSRRDPRRPRQHRGRGARRHHHRPDRECRALPRQPIPARRQSLRDRTVLRADRHP